MGKNPDIEILADSAAIGRRACELFVAEARRAMGERGRFFAAISGGRSPETFFDQLGRSAESLALNWSQVRLFWVDERCVGPDSRDSNYRLANDSFLKKVGVPGSCVFRIRGEEPDRQAEARRYEAVLREAFDAGKSGHIPQFDLMVMGMGADGHTASLFSGSDVMGEKVRLVRAVDASGRRLARITLTPPVLEAARRVVVLIAGEDKARTLRDVLTQPPEPLRYPVQLLCPMGQRVTWLLDRQAAQLLTDIKR